MPEYSSTTITPADSVKTPAMNGSTSGNYELSALKAYILASKGLANGLASLDANGKLPTSQLPDLADDVLVYGSYALLPSPGTAGKLYITADDNKMYRWDDALATPAYVELSVDLSDYATKAEVADAVEDLEAADTDLKNALSATNARVTNLEQKAGGYTVVNYRGTNAVPTGKAKFAMVETLVGKSRPWNNLAKTSDASDTLGGLAFTMSAEGYFTIGTGTASSNAQWGINWVEVVIGHKYLLHECFATRRTSSIYIQDINTRAMETVIVNTSNWNSGDRIFCYASTLSGSSYNSSKKYYPLLRDLTLIFGSGNEPSTVAEAVALCPSILEYDSFGYSMVDTVVEGVRTTTKNLLDVDKWLTDRIGASGYTKNGNSYTFSSSSSLFTNTLVLFDTDTEFTISGTITAGTAVTPRITLLNSLGTALQTFYGGTPKTATGIGIRLDWSTSGSMTLTDIQIELGSSATSYSPYGELDTLSLSSPVTLRSAGSVSDTDELNVEVNGEDKRRQTINVGTLDLGNDLDWSGNTNRWNSDVNSSLPTSYTYTNVLCGIYTYNQLVITDVSSAPDKTFCCHSNRVYIKDTSASDATTLKNNLKGSMLYFGLATPTVTLSDPISNDMIQTEGGGTINTIQTQTTQIDNCMDVGYLAV